jgi:transposase
VRPPGRCDKRFSSTYLFAAARPGHDEAFALVLPEATTATMNLFLAGFSRQLGAGVHAALVLDQAGWHTSGGLVVPDNGTLLPLPPYSPELNPVERVWLYLRERFLSHRWHDSYDDIVEAACAAWTALRTEAGRLASLTAFPWIQCVTN